MIPYHTAHELEVQFLRWGTNFWSDNATGCKAFIDRMLDGEFILNKAVLNAANESGHIVLDCIPTATKLLVDLSQIPTNGGLIINKASTIKPKAGITQVTCSQECIEIECA